jgi:L-lactate dehydrogenase complex protein LldG
MSKSSSREAILGRIRAACSGGQNSGGPPEEAVARDERLPRDYQIRGNLPVRACQELFIERLREYDAQVVECAPEELGAMIAAQLESSGRHVFVAPPGLPSAWLVPAAWQISGFEWNIDHNLRTDEIEKADGVLTACFCAVAESGTIVLHHSATEGRRVLTLLLDWHLCVVRASQIVETLPEYFDRCSQPPPLVTWISGPSATADIEMTRIKGVHGPRFLNVIVVRDTGT